tara:strand:+ start:449 stop:688 length:240 start_codon:yes stop_codon:yes gene_type:complete
MTSIYIKGWKFPYKNVGDPEIPDDPNYVTDKEEFFAQHGNGWWWYRNASDKALAELTPSERNLKKKGGSLSNNGGRRGL